MAELSQPPLVPPEGVDCSTAGIAYMDPPPAPPVGEAALTGADFPPWLIAGCIDPATYFCDKVAPS
jgi:hypothetical protein